MSKDSVHWLKVNVIEISIVNLNFESIIIVLLDARKV